MSPDRLRQVLVLGSFVFAIALNGAANALPLNGQTTAEISDRFRVFVIPAGYVFSIWGVIYLGQLAFVVHTLRPSRRADSLLRRLGLLPALAAVLNGTWIVAWHWNLYPLSLAIMLGLLGTLIAIHRRGGFSRTARPSSGLRGGDRWAVQVPFSIYLGWISIATITNVAVVGNAANVPTFGLEPSFVAALVLAGGIALAAVVAALAADLAFATVVAWAYAGIFVKESAAGTSFVPVVAIAGVVVAVALVGWSAVRQPVPGTGFAPHDP
ncbi:MAG TPA: hypothetical protein VFK54_13290 [Candidatus Limnocylindrales bacterium]|nr:hypothetical protein [Candidatus Limnocylindrales bacterium]